MACLSDNGGIGRAELHDLSFKRIRHLFCSNMNSTTKLAWLYDLIEWIKGGTPNAVLRFVFASGRRRVGVSPVRSTDQRVALKPPRPGLPGDALRMGQ